jgi:hypothetical protein
MSSTPTPSISTNIATSYTNVGSNILVAILPTNPPTLVYGPVTFPWPQEL